MKNIKRNLYLNRIKPYIDKPIVKVITGMRRCGKSVLLRQIMEIVKEKGAEIIYINKEDLAYDFIRNYSDLYEYIKSIDDKRKKKYVFIDEIQRIEEWEKVIVSLNAESDFDIYITGSNSSLLSSEISTLISGRYIEFQVFPLNFNEFLEFRDDPKDKKAEFSMFLKYGGLPGIHHFEQEDEIIFQYLEAIYNTIVLKEVVERYNVRQAVLLKRIYAFLMNNVGNITSSKKISDFLKSQNVSSSVETVINYIDHLISTYCLYEVKRFDLQGKKILEINEKFFSGDIGFVQLLNKKSMKKLPGILENVIFLHLISLGYKVFIGKLNGAEIDFIAENHKGKMYIQVTQSLSGDEVIKREFSPLLKIMDNYPKIVLSLDEYWQEDFQGIKWYNLIEWLITSNKGDY